MENDEVTSAEAEKLREVFKIFDRDQSGFIDPDELGVGLRALGCNPTNAEIDQMIQDAGEKLNSDSGKLDFDGFCEIMSRYRKDLSEVETDLLQAFMVFDKNGDGTIDANELREALKSLGLDKLNDEEVDELLADADTDADGRINYQELVSVICRHN